MRLDFLSVYPLSVHDADALGPFSRWPDGAWKRELLALR